MNGFKRERFKTRTIRNEKEAELKLLRTGTAKIGNDQKREWSWTEWNGNEQYWERIKNKKRLIFGKYISRRSMLSFLIGTGTVVNEKVRNRNDQERERSGTVMVCRFYSWPSRSLSFCSLLFCFMTISIADSSVFNRYLSKNI